MKTVTAKSGNQQFVLKVTNEPMMIDFGHQIDDVLISSPEGDILVSWDVHEWNNDECMLIKTHDNLKEINNLRCTKFLLKACESGKEFTVYLTCQTN